MLWRGAWNWVKSEKGYKVEQVETGGMGQGIEAGGGI